MITLLDIIGRSEIPYSPNTWKVRLALNIKGIPYETHFVEVVDIEATCKSLGVPPSGTKPTGEAHYTLPAIIDDSAPGETIKLSDSRPIIEYLDRRYPSKDGATLFPADLDGLQNRVQDIVNQRILAQSPFLWLLDLYNVKTPKDQENIRLRMEARLGKPMEGILAKGRDRHRHWVEVRRGFLDIDRLAPRSANWRTKGPFLSGEQILYADVVLCALLLCLKTCISGKEWRQIASWNRGRWGKLLDAIQPWIRAEGYHRWNDRSQM
ncbi:hypothetical protein D9756_007230 [Leucocoprinus leucothites]|uniref:GST N-terminal domain-containing protein n=1 Tax=Leucocoprinus leucothites TaxID=201217 RepID=A0A8H5D6T8_9AGAR|nr:hypothetical protein D9756_007230 [Leucoagaricus leucothites]